MTIPINHPLGTVLYVDQEEAASKYISAKFAGDYDLLIAHTAKRALEYLHDHTQHIDVIVTDDKLPNHVESKLLLEAIEEHPYIECILVTADTPREMVAEQKRQGRPWHVLEKPVDLDEVGIAIYSALVRSMRRQMRCQRYEAMKDTVQFVGETLDPHYGAIKHLCERILDPNREGLNDKMSLVREATHVLTSMKKMRDETLPHFRKALRNAGHSIEHVDPHTTAGKLITDVISKMPLSQEELSYLNIEIRNDFTIYKTASLMDLVLTNVIIAALASVHNRSHPRSISISVLIEGTPQIIISDNGTGIDIKGEQHRDQQNPILSVEGSALKLCAEVMSFLGGTFFVTSYPVSESQIILEFPFIEEIA